MDKKLPLKSTEIKNPLIKGFLENEMNRELYKKAIYDFTEENKRLVEDAFAEYYEIVRRTAYFSSMIKFMGIDFDKKLRKLNNRFMLTLDQPLKTETNEGSTMKDMLIDSAAPSLYEGDDTLSSKISDKKLCEALERLTQKQAIVLEMIYVKELSNKEIADIFQTSPQNISNTHKKALKKLKTLMEGDL